MREGDAGYTAGAMPMTAIPRDAQDRPRYVDLRTHTETNEKPENMTHLRGNLLVSKEHPQIAFRGMLDSLQARIMEVQILAARDTNEQLLSALDDALAFVRRILSAEVLDQPLSDISLLGMDSAAIRYESQHVKEVYGIAHPTPDYRMGELCVALNSLRTFTRETELAAVRAFSVDGVCSRQDIVEALNRLSSFVYILFCRQYTGHRPGICVEASGRHVHLTAEAIRILFGRDTLTWKSDLSQPGQYVAAERVDVVTAKGEFTQVAVLGPARSQVQVELSLTDARILGIDIPVNLSGNLKGAGDVILVGPNGMYNAIASAIASKAHIHMTPADARTYGVADGDHVQVRLQTRRPVTIDDVVIRVDENFSLAMHLDYDEANACQFKKGDPGFILS